MEFTNSKRHKECRRAGVLKEQILLYQILRLYENDHKILNIRNDGSHVNKDISHMVVCFNINDKTVLMFKEFFNIYIIRLSNKIPTKK